MSMEAEMSQDLQSASWRPRRAKGVSSSSKAGGLQIQVQRQEETSVPALGSLAGGVSSYSAFLFFSALQLIGWGPPKLGRVMPFTQSADSRVNLF